MRTCDTTFEWYRWLCNKCFLSFSRFRTKQYIYSISCMLQFGNIAFWLSHGSFWNLELATGCMLNGNWRKWNAFNCNTGNKLFYQIRNVSPCNWRNRILRFVFKKIIYCWRLIGWFLYKPLENVWVTNMQIGRLFPARRALIITIINGLYGTSAAVPTIIKLILRLGVRRDRSHLDAGRRWIRP